MYALMDVRMTKITCIDECVCLYISRTSDALNIVGQWLIEVKIIYIYIVYENVS